MKSTKVRQGMLSRGLVLMLVLIVALSTSCSKQEKSDS